MDKMDLVLDKKGMVLSLEGKSLRVQGPGIPLQRLPLGMVGQVVVHGNPMAGAGVPVITFLGQKLPGKYKGKLK